MGEASVMMSAALIERLRRQPYSDVVAITRATLVGDDIYQVHVKSPLLLRGDQGQQCIIIEGDRVRFKKEVDV